MYEKFHFLVDEFTSKRVDETEMFLSKRVDKEIFVQTSAEPNLFGLCRAQPIFVQASAEGKFTWTMPSAAENVKKRCIYMNFFSPRISRIYTKHAQLY